MRPEFVIFDCDGVIVDSEPITNRILIDNLAGYGLPLTLEQVEAMFIGGTMRMVGEKAMAMGARLPPTWIADIYDEMYAELARGTPLIPGIEALLDRLDAEGIGYAVGSNGADRKMSITLGQHPALWARLKDRLFSAHTNGVAKPDPGLYLLAARTFGHQPSACAVVDDSATGCTAGVRAGMVTWGFAEHGDGARLAAVGARVFHRMEELPGLWGLEGDPS